MAGIKRLPGNISWLLSNKKGISLISEIPFELFYRPYSPLIVSPIEKGLISAARPSLNKLVIW